MVFLSFELLWLWNYLGFSLTDPMDFFIAVVWWIVILGGVLAIVLSARRRKLLLRTVFVSEDFLYNAESGLVRIGGDHGTRDYMQAVRKLLCSLSYSPDVKVVRDRPNVKFEYIVRTKKFSGSGRVWTGEVESVVGGKEPKPFSSAQELSQLLAE